MKRYAIADIHGNYKALKEVLKKSKFDYENDELIVLGDICDGYSDSYYVVEELLKVKNLIFVIGNHDCVDSKTELLTKRGWIKYSEVMSNDLIYSFDTIKEKGVWDKINKIIIRNHIGDLISLEGSHCDMLITPNHRVFHKYEGNKKVPHLEKTKYGYELARNMCGSYVIVTSASERLGEFKISDNMLKVSAWVLTDGSIQKKYGYISIYQSKKINLPHIRNLLKCLNLNFKEDIRNRRIREINGRILNGNPLPEHTFRLNSVSSKLVPLKDKNLPEWAFKLSDRQMKIFMDEIIRGDGTKNKSGNGATLYGTKEFLEQIQILCVVKGYRAYLKKNVRGDFVLNITYKNTWIFNASDKQKNNKLGYKKYNDNVWCLNVPLSNFMVRRNGKHYFTGNCWWMEHMATGWAEHIWLAQGGIATINSYKCDSYSYKKIPQSHKDFYNKGVYWYEVDNMLFVHGGFHYPKHPSKNDIEVLIWDRTLYDRCKNDMIEIKGWKKVFVGHTSTEQEGAEPVIIKPRTKEGATLINIDCGAGWKGRLCLYNIDTDEYFLSKFAKGHDKY